MSVPSQYNPESPTWEDGMNGVERLKKASKEMDQESYIISATSGLTVGEDDFLASIPMPPSDPPSPLKHIDDGDYSKSPTVSSPASTTSSSFASSDYAAEAKRTTRWDQSGSSPKVVDGIRSLGAYTSMDDKASSKAASISSATRGLKRGGITFAKNLGFRMSYRGISLRLNSQLNNSTSGVNGFDTDVCSPSATDEDVDSGSDHLWQHRESTQCVELPQESGTSGIGVFGPGVACEINDSSTDAFLTDKQQEEAGSDDNHKVFDGIANGDEFDADQVVVRAEDVSAVVGDSVVAETSKVDDFHVNSCSPSDDALLIPSASLGTVDSQQEMLEEEEEEEETAAAVRPPASAESGDGEATKQPKGRRRRRARGSDECLEGRRRSSRIRSLEERREREREEKLREEMTVQNKPEELAESNETKENVRPSSPPLQHDDDVKREEVSLPKSPPLNVIVDNMDIDPELIPLPPMPPPMLPPLNCAPAFVVPSCQGLMTSRSTSSPGSGSEDGGGGRPEKVKSRWRRNSELERVVLSYPLVSAVPAPPVAKCDEHQQQQVYSTFVDSFSSGSCASTAAASDASSLNVFANSQAMPPILGPPPPPPPVHGFIDPDEITEDWSEKEVTSSLTKNPLPLRPRIVVNHATNTAADSDRTNSSGGGVAKPVVPAVPIKDRPPYMNYEPILENLYLSERRRSKSKREVRRMVCDCSITKEEIEQGFVACGDDCLNRLLMMECGSRCPTGEHCTNRRFQKREYAKVEAIKTEKKGWGLKTLEDLQPGSFVLEYVGEILDQREFKRRVKEYAHDRHRHYYFMALRTDEIIDATQKGNLSRFINHSCDPNCETQKWTVNGDLKVGFFTRRTVQAGDELTFDYQFQRYGKEAQKCHCEAPTCRGFIGGDKQTPLKKDRRDVKKKKAAEERRREELEDMALEEEIEKFSQLDGLRSRAQTLSLCRLMVRAEETEFRLVLLQCLQKTVEQACLRLFLDYHGLSLMWSWMVDIGNGDDTLLLKLEILKTLRRLPITNKNMLMDSKVLSVVERWSAQIAQSQIAKQDGPATLGEVPQLLSKDSVLNMEDSSSDAESLQQGSVARNGVNDTLSASTCDLPPPPPPPLPQSVDEEVAGDAFEEKHSDGSAAFMGLEETSEDKNDVNVGGSVKECDEDSLQMPSVKPDDSVANDVDAKAENDSTFADVENGTGDEQSKDVKVEAVDTVQKEGEFAGIASELLQCWNGLKEVYRIPKREQNLNRREHEREADEQKTEDRENDWDRRGGRDRDDRSDDRKERDRDKQDDDRHNKGNSEHDWDSKSRDTSRDSRRRKKRKGSGGVDSDSEGKGFGSSKIQVTLSKVQRRRQFELKVQQEDEEALRRQQEEYYRQQQEAHIIPIDPLYYDPNYGVVPNPAAVPYYDPATGYALPPIPIVPPDAVALAGPLPNADALGGELPPSSVSSPASNAAVPCPNPIVFPVFPHGAPPVHPNVPPGFIAPPPPGGPSYPPHSAPPPFPHQLPPPAQQAVFYPPPPGVVVHLPDQAGPWPHVVTATVVEDAPPPPDPAKPAKLPPGWKTAKDSEGNVYYYHTVTRQTQWEPPPCQDSEMDDGTSDDSKKKKSTTTAPADTSSELARRIKEHFRSKMSQFIVQCLNPYRKPDCKLGRIASTDEFKHLARKLTHFVMAKELKYCRNVEDLECNENVKHKAKDFVHKYMAKFGPVYKKAASPKDEDDD